MRRAAGVAAVCLLGGVQAAWGDAGQRQGGPAVKLTLETLGVPAVSQNFLDAGASMLTVNFLDAKHLLLTYGERGLVPRLENDPKDDDDRLVAAEVLELPSGKVMARDEWHMHDHGRYLWALGRGRFLVRIGNTLSLMTPGANLGSAHPLMRSVFSWRPGRPSALFVSEDGGLLTLESQVKAAQSPTELGDDPMQQPVTTLLDFYRLSGDGSQAAPLTVTPVGNVRSPQAFYLPIDSRGYLWPTPTGNNAWTIMFDDMRGKTARVGTLQSSCTPRLEMVSHSEFVAMTCRGSDDRVRMASYGLDAQETWEEDFGDFGPPVFAYASAAGRFAVSRKVSDPVSVPTPSLPGMVAAPQPTPVDRQEVRVYQTASGDLVGKIDCFPAMKTGENFALSEDGMQLAVVREGALEVFRLPELKPRDKEDLAEVEKFAPPPDDGPVVLSLLTGGAKPAAAPATTGTGPKVAGDRKLPNGPVMAVRGEPTTIAATAMPGVARHAAADSTLTPVTTQEAAAEVVTTGRKKPPTLLYPGEHAEFGGSNGGGETPE